MADEATIPKFSKSLTDVTVTELEKTILECKVDATPKPAVSWQCNGKDLKVRLCSLWLWAMGPQYSTIQYNTVQYNIIQYRGT